MVGNHSASEEGKGPSTVVPKSSFIQNGMANLMLYASLRGWVNHCNDSTDHHPFVFSPLC
jgi:hypothetical protein